MSQLTWKTSLITFLVAFLAVNIVAEDTLSAGALGELRSQSQSSTDPLRTGGPEAPSAQWDLRSPWGMDFLAAENDPRLVFQTSESPNVGTMLDAGVTQLSSWLFTQAKAKANERFPEWMKRWDISAQVGTGRARFYTETVQPLWQTKDFGHTFFIQPRISIQDSRGTYNVGLGYRKLLFDNSLLVGVNSFYDYADRKGHARLGGGVEILSQSLEIRGNVYEPTSNARLVESTATSTAYEKAVAGYDVEAGGVVPYVPDLKLYGRHQTWDFKSGRDLVRDGGRVELYLTSFFRIDAEAFYDNYVGGWAHRVGFVLRSDFSGDRGLFTRGFARQVYTPVDVRAVTLHRVVREFNIITERTETSTSAPTGTVTVRVGRGT